MKYSELYHFHGVDRHFRIVSKSYNRNARKDATTRQSDETLGPAYKIVANISFTEVDDKTMRLIFKSVNVLIGGLRDE